MPTKDVVIHGAKIMSNDDGLTWQEIAEAILRMPEEQRYMKAWLCLEHRIPVGDPIMCEIKAMIEEDFPFMEKGQQYRVGFS